jgi:hypothetical protein
MPFHAENRYKRKLIERKATRGAAATGMKKLQRHLVTFGLCMAMAFPAAAQDSAQTPVQVQTPAQTLPSAQTPAARPRAQEPPPNAVSVDGSEAMFTTMCALLAAGFESNVSSANWSPFRAQMRERLRQQQGPAVDALREFYRIHELRDPGETLSRY